jgi:hypothetical protein
MNTSSKARAKDLIADPEAERTVIGAVLTRPEVLPEASLSPDARERLQC